MAEQNQPTDGAKEPSIEDIEAGDAFRETMIPRADAINLGAPMWYGWAIMDAYLAGLYAGRAETGLPELLAACKRAKDYCDCGNVQDVRHPSDESPSLSEQLEDVLARAERSPAGKAVPRG